MSEEQREQRDRLNEILRDLSKAARELYDQIQERGGDKRLEAAHIALQKRISDMEQL